MKHQRWDSRFVKIPFIMEIEANEWMSHSESGKVRWKMNGDEKNIYVRTVEMWRSITFQWSLVRLKAGERKQKWETVLHRWRPRWENFPILGHSSLPFETLEARLMQLSFREVREGRRMIRENGNEKRLEWYVRLRVWTENESHSNIYSTFPFASSKKNEKKTI